jgi:ABC-2 type transport system permease protein
MAEATALRATPDIGGVWRVLGNETAKGLLILWSHRVTLVPQVANMAVMYLALQYVIGGGGLVRELLPATTLAYATYVLGYIALLKMSAGIAEEMNTGTLGQSMLSPLPAWALSIGRLGATLVEGTVVAGIIGIGFVVALDIDIPLRWAALLPLALTVIDVGGFALLIGGLTLTIASIGAVVHVIQGLVMMLNGSLIPVYLYPPALEVVAKLTPSTLGIDATRSVLFENASLAEVWSNGSLPLATVHAGVMLLLGWIVYQRNTRRALREGRL